MSYYASFEDALDEFVADAIIEDGSPVLPCSGDWSIYRAKDGRFYLSSVREDCRDECMISARDIPDLVMDWELLPGDISWGRSRLYDEILKSVDY